MNEHPTITRAKAAITAADEAFSRDWSWAEISVFTETLERDYFADWQSEGSVVTAVQNMLVRGTTQRANAQKRRGSINKKTQFLIWAIDLAFDDFGKWWAERSDQSVSWRHERIIQTLSQRTDAILSDLPANLVGLDVEQSGDVITIQGKPLTAGQLKSVIPHLVKDS